MPNDINLPSPQINPGSMGGGGYGPNPLDAFVTNFLSAQQRKSSESQAARSHEIEQSRLKLLEQDLKFRQQQEITKQSQQDAQGGAAQALIKALTPRIEQESQYSAPGQPTPTMQMLGLGPQNQQQGPQQPAGSPNPPQGGIGSQPDPMQVFSSIVDKLPAGAVADFVKQFGGIAKEAQAKKDQAKAFTEAEKLLTGLLGPDQAGMMKSARLLFDAGMPQEIWQAMLPKAQMELAKGYEEVRAQKNKREADKLATAQLVRLGLQPVPPQGMSEFVVDGAAKILSDYVADVRKDARQANIARAKSEREEAVAGVEGTALELASTYGMNGPAIKAALKHTYPGLSDGILAKAAMEAPSKAQKLTAPANENQAKARLEFPILQGAVTVINALDAKGEGFGVAARLAQTDKLGGGSGMMGGLGAGAIGGLTAGVPGALAGGALGLLAPGAIRGGARMAMSTDQQRLFTAAEALQNAVNRMESGATVNPAERTDVYQRYVPLNTDDLETRKLKRVLRGQLLKTWASIAGMPEEMQKSIIQSLLSKQEQMLPNRSAPNNSDLVPKIRGLFGGNP